MHEMYMKINKLSCVFSYAWNVFEKNKLTCVVSYAWHVYENK
jgi:hypothetical protein